MKIATGSMELNSDLVALQGILTSVIKHTGEFTKINYRGGNEEKILDISSEIAVYLRNKSYIKNGVINTVFEKQLEDIVFFLALNTNYKEHLELDQYCNLINIMPQLSKCVLVNVIYSLDLCKYFCFAIERLPIRNSIELLEETIPCIKKSTPNIHLSYAFMFLEAAANKLMVIDSTEKAQEDIEDLCEVTYIILQNLTGLYSAQTKNWNALQIYQHMGYSLLRLFDLLLYCDKNNSNFNKYITNILQTCCAVVKNVTINVYCAWAEVSEAEQPLQCIISEKAYLVVEAYQKSKEAKELLSMLGTIAKKPKSLSERIQEADISMIIKNVYKNDQDQMAWFQALFATHFLQNKEGVKCISTWAHLSTEHNVTKLLNMSLNTDNVDAKSLAIKCAATLNLEQLISACMKYFYTHKFQNILREDVQPQLILIFNKMNGDANKGEDFVKDIVLLLLQNPTFVSTYIYDECLKNKFYTECLTPFFSYSNIKEISTIDDFSLNTLKNVLWKNIMFINLDNTDNYVVLLRTLLKANYCSDLEMLHKVLFPLVEQVSTDFLCEELRIALQLIQEIEIRIPVKEETRHIIETLVILMNNLRCTFLEYSDVNQQITNTLVGILKCCEINPNYNFKVEILEQYDDFTVYYIKYLTSERNSSLFKSICCGFDPKNYTNCVSLLLRVLPRSVSCEWFEIVDEVIKECGSEKTVELLSDVMILLCELAQTQINCDTEADLSAALKYCLQHFGLIIQKIQASSTVNTEVQVTKNICRLLRHIPGPIRSEEGLLLTNLLTNESLKTLADDKEFICLLIAINDKSICKMLAQRITS